MIQFARWNEDQPVTVSPILSLMMEAGCKAADLQPAEPARSLLPSCHLDDAILWSPATSKIAGEKLSSFLELLCERRRHSEPLPACQRPFTRPFKRHREMHAFCAAQSRLLKMYHSEADGVEAIHRKGYPKSF